MIFSTDLPRRSRGFTLIELLCVIVIVGLLAALLLPALTRGQAQARRAQCAGQLRQVGLAFHIFAHDHNNRFPMEIPQAGGGSQDYATTPSAGGAEVYFSFRHLIPLAADLVTPRVLLCPADNRTAAHNFAQFDNRNLSYFVGLNARIDLPESILSGDRNLTNDWDGGRSIVLVNSEPLRWSHELHRFRGNLLFADGHVSFGGQTSVRPDNGRPIANAFLPSVRAETAAYNPSGSGGPPSGTASKLPQQAQPPNHRDDKGEHRSARREHPAPGKAASGITSGQESIEVNYSVANSFSASNTIGKPIPIPPATVTNVRERLVITNLAIWSFGMAETAQISRETGLEVLLGLFVLILIIAYLRKLQKSRRLQHRFR